MEKAGKRAAKRAYVERKLDAGVFAVYCAPENRRWVGAAADIAAARNRFWFNLRNNAAPNADIAAAHATHGDSAFLFETLENVDPEKPPVYLRDHLEARAKHWREKLGAAAL